MVVAIQRAEDVGGEEGGDLGIVDVDLLEL
jgi:hypothetical protein